ncbi:uncharacterized protein [Malus domestica]|uniref:uncharacterized protein n=1 Tax=Malus domestica TaxID=3750 RepID=UPI00397570A1
MPPEVAAIWEVFKQLFQKRFVPPEYIDRKKQEFTHMKQGKMTANEYYRRFTDLSRYDPKVSVNPVEMLRRFRLENMPNESEEEEEKNGNQRNDDKGKGQSSQGPHKTQSFKRSGVSSSSSSGGLSSNVQMRGGRFSRGPKFQRQRNFGRSGEAAVDAILVDRWGIRLHIALRISRGPKHLPYHHLRRPSKFHDLVVMPKLVMEPGGSMPYQPHSASGSQWYQEGQPQQVKIATSCAGSSRQSGQPRQGRGIHANSGRGERQQNQGRIHNMTLQYAQNNPDLIIGTLNILGHFARVLIDCGVTHSIVSHTFVQVTQPHPTPLGYDLQFSMAIGEICYVNLVYPGCPMMVEDVVMPANLIPLDIVDFDVMLGTNWLHYNRANIDCYGKVVTFHRPGLPEVTFVG